MTAIRCPELSRFSLTGITVLLAIPGERYEIECLANGGFEVSRFKGAELCEMTVEEVLKKVGE